MLATIAQLLIVLTALYFIGLSAISLAFPARAAEFLGGFARSASAHYLELFLRLLVGAAFVWRAPHLPLSGIFAFFGWVLVATTACLLAVPWRWHRWFAERSVPHALRHLNLVAAASLAIGVFVLGAVLRGPDL